MAAKKGNDPTVALGEVIHALEPLDDTDRQWVLQAAASKFALVVTLPAGGPGMGFHAGAGSPMVSGTQTPIRELDPKTFMKNKNPNSDIQRVACLAYYLNHARDVAAFKTSDITKLNIDARGPKFNITRAIDNASRATCGYLSLIGKGQKQLAAFGEEIVEALPSHEAVKALEGTRNSSRRGRAKKVTRSKRKAL